MSRGLQVVLALLRIATGISVLGPGLSKLGWFAHPPLEQTLANWAQHAPNGLVVRYLHLVTPHHATLGLLMVAQYHFASGAMFQGSYLFGQNGLVYLLIFPVLVAGRAGVSLGLDGILGRSMHGVPRPL